jgi:hypothetical protein
VANIVGRGRLGTAVLVPHRRLIERQPTYPRGLKALPRQKLPLAVLHLGGHSRQLGPAKLRRALQPFKISLLRTDPLSIAPACLALKLEGPPPLLHILHEVRVLV